MGKPKYRVVYDILGKYSNGSKTIHFKPTSRFTLRIFDSSAPSGLESKLGSIGASTLAYDSRCSNESVPNTSSRHRGGRLCRRTEAPGMLINLSSWCHCSTHLSSLVGILFYSKFISNCLLSSSGTHHPPQTAIVHLFSH